MGSKHWFPHDFYTRNKSKLSYLMYEYGTSGYGLFWVIVEMLYESSDNWLELNDKVYASIAQQTKDDKEYIKTFIEKCINDFEVFTESDGRFTTDRVLEHSEKMNVSINKKRHAGKASAKKRAENVTSKTSTDVEQMLNTCSTEPEKRSTDKIRLDKNRSDQNTEENKETTPNGVVDSDESPPELLKIPLYEPKNRNDLKYVHDFIRNNSPTDYRPYMDLWNIFAEKTGMPKLLNFKAERQRKLKTRLKEKEFDLIKILAKAAKSDFCKTGKWFTFDWIISGSKYQKVLEGNYDNRNEVKNATISTKLELSPAEKKGEAILASIEDRPYVRKDSSAGG